MTEKPRTGVYSLLSVRLRRDHLRCMHAACGSKDKNQESVPSKMLWSTVSKAFFRSRKRSPFSEPLSIFKYQSFLASSIAVRVECIGLKQCCESARRPCSFR